MSQQQLTLPPNAQPLLPSQHRTALNHHIEANINSLSGVDSDIAGTLFDRANINSLELQNRPDGDPVLVTDYLRVREDDTLALHPVVRHVVSEDHHDQLLEDLVRAYHGRLIEENGTSRSLEPVPGFPEPALVGLNNGFDLAYLRPEFALTDVDVGDCVGHDCRTPSAYPIQVHDILADLRAEGIVTSLVTLGCEACGHEAAHELADQLRNEGETVHGFAGIAAQTPAENPLISVESFDESQQTCGDIVDLVLDSAHNHSFRSSIRVMKAGLLRK